MPQIQSEQLVVTTYLEHVQETLSPSSLKSHVVNPFGTSFLAAASVALFDLQGEEMYD